MNTTADSKARTLAESLLRGPCETEAQRAQRNSARGEVAAKGNAGTTRADDAVSRRMGPPFNYGRARRFVRWYDGLLQAHLAAAAVIAGENIGQPSDKTEEVAEPTDLLALLLVIHRLLLAHPAAVRAAFAALVAEGRCYATSREGRALEQRLLRSASVHQASRLFRSLSMGMLSDAGAGPLPSSYLDNLMRIVDMGAVEKVVGDLMQRFRRQG